MEKIQVPQVVLNSGHKMPLVGMGCSVTPLLPPEQLTSKFLDAIEAGYRHFDTATIYGTEKPLGQAVAEALERGLINSRDEMFITSKVWCDNVHQDHVLPAMKETLRNLGLEYVDLYLVHWPVRVEHNASFNFKKEQVLPFDISGTWKAMEECCRLGLAKSIGVSNFSSAKVSNLLQIATIPPAVNQVEMNVTWQQQKLRNLCQDKGVHLSAWFPLGGYNTVWGSNAVMENPTLKNIAVAKSKSTAQIALRWIYEQGASIIVKSFNKERMKENLQIFDWQLTKEELSLIEQIPQHRCITGDVFVHPNGPYKSVEEIWDGEI